MAWLAAAMIACGSVVLTPWALPVAVAIHIVCAIDSYRVAAASPRPLRVLHPMVGLVTGCGIAYALVLRGFVVEAFRIPSSSMHPTLQIGDHLLVDKLSPRWRAISRGELIVYSDPCTSTRSYVKRVAAVGGDTVEIRCNVLYVNGAAIPSTPLQTSCAYQDYDDLRDTWYERTCSRYHEVQNGHSYDVLHDPDRPNRDANLATLTEGDSRDFPQSRAPSCANTGNGSANADQILGKVVATEVAPNEGPCKPQLHYVVPADHLFVLGDHRNNSNDSRVWGAVPVANVIGRVHLIWLSRGANGIDWSRVGVVE